MGLRGLHSKCGPGCCIRPWMHRAVMMGGVDMKRIPYYLDHEMEGAIGKEYAIHELLKQVVRQRFKRAERSGNIDGMVGC